MPRRYVLDGKAAAWVSRQIGARKGTNNKRVGSFRDESPQTLPFYNDTGEEIPAYGIVRVDDYVSAHDSDTLKVRKPGVSDIGPASTFAANGGLPVAAGEYGVLQIGPLVKVVYDSADSPNNRDWYGIDGFKARSYPNGKPYFQIMIEMVVDSTNKIAWARLMPFTTLMIKAPSGGIPGRVGSLLGSASCTIIVRSNSNEQLSQSTLSVKVLNWSTSAACTAGDRYGIASVIDGKWHIVAEDCNDEGSTVQPGTGSGSGGRVTDAIDTSTISPAVTNGQFNNVTFSGTGTGSGPS